MSERRNLMKCDTCGAERRCSDGLRQAALAGRITCAVCAAKGREGYFVDANRAWKVATR